MFRLGRTGIVGNIFTRETTCAGEDDIEEKEHGRALVSKFHGELALQRGTGHGGGYRIGQWALT